MVRDYHAGLAHARRSALPTRTPAERLDAAVDEVLTGRRPAVSAELTPLVDAASLVRSALAPLPAGTRFEAQLAWRLTHPGTIARLVSGSLRHPARLLISGAVSSLAVGIGITLLALRRGSRRRADIAARPAHR